MPGYDASYYDPPAPIATVTLRAANGATVADVLLLLDTGADITLLPISAIARLGINPDPALQYELVGFDGTRSTSQAVDLDMLFRKRHFAAGICSSTPTAVSLDAMCWPLFQSY